MLAHVLNMPRLKLYLDFERVLTESELAALRDCIQRRGRREPLQHILGTVSFCGLELEVNRHVLVPRPETEVLAEQAWSLIQSKAVMEPAVPLALDFGCGSGCLAIAMATRCRQVRVHAVDISPDALAVARRNAARHQLESRIDFFQGDGFNSLPKGTRYQWIVSNPPYIASGDIASLEPEVRDYDPVTALDGGGDGLAFYRRLAQESVGSLASEARLLLEIGDDQASSVGEIFGAGGWKVEAVVPDLSALPRTERMLPPEPALAFFRGSQDMNLLHPLGFGYIDLPSSAFPPQRRSDLLFALSAVLQAHMSQHSNY
jgi:release factor glutamine methyltransferase